MIKRRARVLKATNKQTGKSNRKRDMQRTAMKGGKRISKSGKIYYERRRNRSDVRKYL